MTRSRSIGLVAALALAACSSPQTQKKEPAAPASSAPIQALPEGENYNRANIAYFEKLIKAHKKEFELAAQSFPISVSPLASVNYVVITGKVPPHKHVEHDEVFILVSGEGILSVESRDGGIETHELSAGSIFHVPRGVAHAYQNTGIDGEPTLGINVFSPAYTEPDRVAVDWTKKGSKKDAEKKPGN